jgi:hypothetical protein
VYAAALLSGDFPAAADRAIPPWAQLLQATVFAAIGGVLLALGRRDPRAWSLGLFIVDSGSTLAEPLLRRIADPGNILSFALHLRTDAFQAAMIWFFASWFPAPAGNAQLGRAFRVATAGAFGLGIFLVAADAYAISTEPLGRGSGFASHLAQQLQRNQPGDADWYFTLQFLILSPLLVLEPLKLREWGPDHRRRFAWLVGGLLLGLAPLVIVSTLPTISPAAATLMRPHLRVIGVGVLLALTLIPLSAAYAALVQRTLDLRLALGTAIRYLLARSAIVIVLLLPIATLATLVFVNRNRTIGDLVAGSTGVALAALCVAGFALAAARPRLLAMVDRTFFREHVDARHILNGLVERISRAASVADISAVWVSSIDAAFHPESIHLVVADARGLHTQLPALPNLPPSATLITLLEAGDGPMMIDWRPGSVFHRLGVAEQEWLHGLGADVLVPIPGSSRPFHAVIAVGKKKSELPYGRDEVSLLAAVASACGLAIERIRHAAPVAALAHDAAAECRDCGVLHPAFAPICTCGGMLQVAPVPEVLDGRFRLTQRLGAGGMGVVYRAIDIRLGQDRVAKTLPRTDDPAMVTRLRREARAMAAVNHPNLATLYGLEVWHDTPILIMEFLGGKTLAARLTAGPLTAAHTLSVGLALAGGLRALHAAGVLHRDVKPTNIAFTTNGTPKLIDFGLAIFLPATARSTQPEAANPMRTGSVSTDSGTLRGTLGYLSPEALAGRPPSTADDVWSLSVTLLEACSGENPFRATNAVALVARGLAVSDISLVASAIPSALQSLFRDLLGAERPSSAQDFIRRLERIDAD